MYADVGVCIHEKKLDLVYGLGYGAWFKRAVFGLPIIFESF